METLLRDTRLAALSLLLSTGAETCEEIACCIKLARGPLQPRTESGQFYLHNKWRIRHEHMSGTAQTFALKAGDVPTASLHKQFVATYSPLQIEHHIYSIIGHARTAGVRALL